MISPDFDLGWGITTRRYTEAGYRLAYLQCMYMRERPLRESIIDVRMMGPAERRELLRAGYRYAVLERDEPARGVTRATR